MASTKISELTSANMIAVSDVLPFVSDPSGSPTTKKITANNFANSILANVQMSVVPSTNATFNLGSLARSWNNVHVKTLYANGSPGSNGKILTSNGTVSFWSDPTYISTNVNAQYTWTNNHTFQGGISYTGQVTFANNIKTQAPTEVNLLSSGIAQLQYNPNNQVSSDYTTDSTWVYVWPGNIGSEVYSGNNLVTGFYLTTSNIQMNVLGSTWVFTNREIVFPDSTTQTTAVNKVIPPQNSTANGTPGQIAWDSNAIYVCVETNSWKKADLYNF